MGGFIYLLMGADLLVRGAVALARRARVPPLVVALTVVALGTSLPELVVAVQAALAGHPGIVLGNVVGSNVANVLVVAGAAAALHPLAPGGRSVGRDALVMILSSLLFIGLGAFGGVDRLDGAFLLLGLAGALTLIVRDALRERKVIAVPIEWTLGLPHRGGLIALFLVAGALGLPVGARLAVEAAVDIALGLGLTETVVGLTIIAFSTSLPELATAVVAARRHDTDLVLGTVVGSNTLNLLAIMGVSALLSPARIPFPREVVVVDLPLMLGAALVIALFVWRGRTVGRIAGTLLVLGYVGYAVALFVRG